MKHEFSEAFDLDLEELLDWIFERNQMRAFSFIEEIREICVSLIAQKPGVGSYRPHLGTGIRGFHSARHDRTIFYIVDEDAQLVTFLRLVGRQNISAKNLTERDA